MLDRLKNWWPEKAPNPAQGSYIALLQAARNPFFFRTLGAPDTLDGRFETIVLHLWLVQERLRGEPGHEAFARALAEIFFDDMHRAIRELGVLDPGKRVKRMAKAYHGRLQNYTAAGNDDEALKAAFARNLYGTLKEGDVEQLNAAAAYARHMQRVMASASVTSLMDGSFRWPEPAAI